LRRADRGAGGGAGGSFFATQERGSRQIGGSTMQKSFTRQEAETLQSLARCFVCFSTFCFALLGLLLGYTRSGYEEGVFRGALASIFAFYLGELVRGLW